MSHTGSEITRRGLVAAGAGMALAGAAGNAAAQNGGGETAKGRPMPKIETPPPMPPDRQLGWAVVGLGKFAVNQIMPAFAQCKRSKLVALVSGNRDKARTLAAQYGVAEKSVYDYANFDSIRDNPEVDVVYIILPNALHAEYTVRAAKAGKHVMCEKPMAVTVAECQTMIDACNAANRKLMIGYRAQFEPHNVEAIRMARSGELGKIKFVSSDHGRPTDPKDPADQWRLQKSLAGGGSLYDIGIYSLNAARYLTGEEPNWIAAQIYSTPGDARFREVEEAVSWNMRFPGGALANCTCSYNVENTKRIQAMGTERRIELDPGTEYYGNRLMVKTGETSEERKVANKSQFVEEIDHLSECVAANKKPKTPGEEGLQDVKLMQAIYAAARENRPVTL